MADHQYSPHASRVQRDGEIMRELIYGDLDDKNPADQAKQERLCALREHQVYRLLRSVVSQLNTRLKGRRERFKLVEEGDGLVLEYLS